MGPGRTGLPGRMKPGWLGWAGTIGPGGAGFGMIGSGIGGMGCAGVGWGEPGCAGGVGGWPGLGICPGAFQTTSRPMTVRARSVRLFFNFMIFRFDGLGLAVVRATGCPHCDSNYARGRSFAMGCNPNGDSFGNGRSLPLPPERRSPTRPVLKIT